MALTPEERQQMELCYAKPNHGFRYPSYSGVDLSHITLSDYEHLWEKPFADYMAEQGFTSLEKAKSNNDIRPYIEGILGLLPLNDGSGKIYDYVVDTLYEGKMGQILARKDEIVDYLNKQEKEITSDYEEDWGAKKNLFLRATHYSSEDGDEKGYFFRFWRYPISKLLAYRNISLITSEDRQSATKILTDLFGPNASTYRPEDLIDETPEHLVEQREEIERQKRSAQRASETEKQRLMDQPLHEMFVFSGIHFSDTTDTEKMAQEAFANPDAHRILSNYCPSSDAFDETIFKQVITLTPNQIKFQADTLKSDLMDRTDDVYLSTHPDSTFEAFLNDRRGKAAPTGDMTARETTQKALQKILGTTVKLDDKTVQDALPYKCTDLKSHSSEILQTAAKRKKRKMIAIISSVSALSAFLIFGLYKGAQITAEGINALGEKVTDVSHYTQEKTKEIVERVKSEHTNRTENVQKSSETNTTTSATTTNTTTQTTIPQPPPKSTFKLKGNRPVSGAFWKGWRDPNGREVEPMALQMTMTAEFNHLLEQMQQNKTTFDSVFKPEKIATRIMETRLQWQLEALSGQTPVRFFIGKEGKSNIESNKGNKENLIRDVLNFHFNTQDVLNNIPVPAAELASEQVKTMEAIGPTIGWSIYQQLAWAKNNPEKMQSAASTIKKGANGILTAQQADKSDITAVFKATCLAIKDYRNTHPEIQSYLLLAQQTVYDITGEKAQDLSSFRHFKETDLDQANACLKKVSHIKPKYSSLDYEGQTLSPHRRRRGATH